MTDIFESLAAYNHDRDNRFDLESDDEFELDEIADAADEAYQQGSASLDTNDIRRNIRLILSGLIPRAVEYLKEGKNIEFIDIPDIARLAEESLKKIPGYLQQKALTRDSAMSAPLSELAHSLPAFFTRFQELLPDLNAELDQLKHSRQVSGTREMSVLETRFHKLRQHAAALSRHISGVFGLLESVETAPTHFIAWELWEEQERSARRSALSVTEYKLRESGWLIDNFNNKNPDEKMKVKEEDPKLANLMKMNALMNLASWEERRARLKLVPSLLASAGGLQTAIRMTQQSAKNLQETVWRSGKARGLYTPAGDTLEGRAYLLAGTIERVSIALGKVAGKLAEGKQALPPDTLLQEYGDNKGMLSTAVQELKTGARVLAADPLPPFIKKLTHNYVKYFDKAIYKGEFNPLMPEQEEAILRVGIILSDRLQHLRRNVALLDEDSRLLQLARERKAVSEKLPANFLSDTALDSALANAPAAWQKSIEQAGSGLQSALERMRTLPVENERRRFVNKLRDMLGAKPGDPTVAQPVLTFGAFMEQCVNGMGKIEDEMAELTTGILTAPGQSRAELLVSLAKWRAQLGRYKADIKAGLALFTGRSANDSGQSILIAKELAEHLQEYRREYLEKVNMAERKEAGALFNTVAREVMADYTPLLAKKGDSRGVSFLQRFELEMKNAERGDVIYPTTMGQILTGMKSLDERMRSWALRQLVRRGFYRHIIRGISLIPELLSLPLRLTFRVITRSTITAVIVVSATRKADRGIRMGQGGSGRANRNFLARLVKEGALKTLLSSVPGLPLMAGFAAIKLELNDGKAPIRIALDRFKDTARELPWQLLDRLTRETTSAFHEGRAKADFRTLMQTLYGDEYSQSAHGKEEGSEKLTAGKELRRIAIENVGLAGLAHRLAGIPGKAQNVSIWQSDDPTRSYYDLEDHGIRLGAGATDQEKLHEIAHAMTAHQLRHGLQNPSSHLGKQVEMLDKLRLRASGSYTGNDPFMKYYFGTLDEFVAGLYSGNDDFTAHLESITFEGESLFTRAVKAICRLLGVGEESHNALAEAMRLTDALMSTPLAKGEGEGEGQLNSSNSRGSQPEIISSNHSIILPNARKVGGFRSHKPVMDDIPEDFQVQLIIKYQNGKMVRVVISVDDNSRKHPHWQESVAQQINSLSTDARGVKIGKIDREGVITPSQLRNKNHFFVDASSTIASVEWSFVSNDIPDDPELIRKDMILGDLGSQCGQPTLNRKTKIPIRIRHYTRAGQEITWEEDGDHFSIDVDTLLSKEKYEWTDYSKFISPEVIIEWPESFSTPLRLNLRGYSVIRQYRSKNNKIVTSPLENINPALEQKNPQQNRHALTTPTIVSSETAPGRIDSHDRKILNFDHDISYEGFSDEQKNKTYIHGINFVLAKIKNDPSLSKPIKDNARLAILGAKNLVAVDIAGYRINNTLFLPEGPGSKSGVLIRLDSDLPYYYVNKGSDLLYNIESDMPHNADIRPQRWVTPGLTANGVITYLPSGIDKLNSIRRGELRFNRNFNYNRPRSTDIAGLSEYLANTMEADYRLKGKRIKNKLLISRAIAGAHIPDPGVTVTEVKSRLAVNSADLTPAQYLRAFAKPFAALSGDMQLIASSIEGESIQETELHVHHAEYIGSWIDATAGAITSFTPQGVVLNSVQSAADIAADLAEGKQPDPLAVAGLVMGWIPGEKIAVKVGKFTALGAKTVKYGLMIGNKVIDLAIVGSSIKAAVETGEPLAIYQALLASGMSIDNSYKMAISMSSQLKINKELESGGQLRNLQQNQRGESVVPDEAEIPSQQGLQTEESSENTQDIIFSGSSTGSQSFGTTTHVRLKATGLIRFVGKAKFAGTRIESFDPQSSKFNKSDEFTVAHTGELDKKADKKISSASLVSSLTDMESKTASVVNHLEAYTGNYKDDIANNMNIIKGSAENMRGNLNKPNKLDTNHYVLTGKGSTSEDITNHYGLAEVKYAFGSRDISIPSLIAHPYVVINKYPEFKEFLIREGHVSRAVLDKYNIRNVGRYLGSKALRSEIDYYESIPNTKVKTFSFDGANPITQRFGNQLESLSKLFFVNNSPDEESYLNDREEDELAQSQSAQDTLYQDMINNVKAKVRNEFLPVRPIVEMSAEKTNQAIAKIMSDGEAKIVSSDIASSNVEDERIKEYSREVVASVDRAHEKVNSVKSLFESAESQPAIKEGLKKLIDQATGLNDEVLEELDDVDISDISDMAYNRFKDNVYALETFLSKQKNERYSSFVLFEYNQFESSKPDAYALPYDSNKRILLAVLPENQRHGGLVDTVVHEASHNASYTLDHTYIGNTRSETGSFPSAFEESARNSKYFNTDTRVNRLSTNYALGLPENSTITNEQQNQANVILQNSRLVKADTLLNAAEYNAYMIDVLSKAKVKGSSIELANKPSRNRRQVPGTNHEQDNIVMLASLKVSLPGK